MKTLYTPLHSFVALLTLCTATPLLAQTAERDSISREMVLERDYVPAANQAKKAFFNPLAGTKSQALKPLNFANNTYEVSMNVRPRLFEPIENSMAKTPEANAWHFRLFGGYPVRYGANLGMIYAVQDKGSIELALDHLSQDFNTIERASGIAPKNKTHDTSLGLKYNGKLDDRLYSIGVEVFNHMHTMYGLGETTVSTAPNTPFSNPLYRMTGGALSFELSPAPLALRSSWQYSLFGHVGYTSKQDVEVQENLTLPEDPRHKISGVDMVVGGNLSYGLMTYNVHVGADVQLAGNQLFGISLPDGAPASQYLSVDPYLAYVVEHFSIKAGARLQLLSFGPKRFLVTPKVLAKWEASEQFALIAEANGGASIQSMRELYQMNRYAQGASVYFSNDIAQYNASMGFQVGNLGGFSAEVRGGYADYLNMYHWTTHLSPFSSAPDAEPLVYFMAQDRGRVKNVFVTAGARYISPVGLQASVGVKYNKYTRQIADDDTESEATRSIVAGRPSLEVAASLDYQMTPQLSAHVDLTGLGGIKFIIPTTQGLTTRDVPFITDLNARVSYKVHPNIGVSLMGLNLFNQVSERWAFYQRPGTSVVGAVTFNF